MQRIVYLLGFLEIFVAIATIAACSFLFYLLSKTRLLHTAFRITIRIFSVAVIVYMLLSIALVLCCTIRDDISLRYQKPRADLSPDNIVHELQQSASFSFWLALSFMTIERSLASHFVSSYENKFNTTRAQAFLIFLFIFVDFVENLCRVLIPEPTILIVCFSNTFVNLFVSVMYYIKRVNTRRNVIERHLSYRYQCNENVMISTAILPLTYIIFIFSFGLLPFILMMDSKPDQQSRELGTASFYFISAIFPLTYTLGLLRSKALRKIMISQGFIKELRQSVSFHDQYEQTRNTQNALWRVAK